MSVEIPNSLKHTHTSKERKVNRKRNKYERAHTHTYTSFTICDINGGKGLNIGKSVLAIFK